MQNLDSSSNWLRRHLRRILPPGRCYRRKPPGKDSFLGHFDQEPTEEDGKDDHHGSSCHDENDDDVPYRYPDEDDDDVGMMYYCFSCRSDTTPNHQAAEFQTNQKQHQSLEK